MLLLCHQIFDFYLKPLITTKVFFFFPAPFLSWAGCNVSRVTTGESHWSRLELVCMVYDVEDLHQLSIRPYFVMLCIFLNPRPDTFYVFLMKWSFWKSTIKKQNEMLQCFELAAWCGSGLTLSVTVSSSIITSSALLFVWGWPRSDLRGVLHPDLQMAPCDSVLHHLRSDDLLHKPDRTPHLAGWDVTLALELWFHVPLAFLPWSPLGGRWLGSLLIITFHTLNVSSYCKCHLFLLSDLELHRDWLLWGDRQSSLGNFLSSGQRTTRGIMGFSAVVVGSMSSRYHEEHFHWDVGMLKENLNMSLMFIWRWKWSTKILELVQYVVSADSCKLSFWGNGNHQSCLKCFFVVSHSLRLLIGVSEIMTDLIMTVKVLNGLIKSSEQNQVSRSEISWRPNLRPQEATKYAFIGHK